MTSPERLTEHERRFLGALVSVWPRPANKTDLRIAARLSSARRQDVDAALAGLAARGYAARLPEPIPRPPGRPLQRWTATARGRAVWREER